MAMGKKFNYKGFESQESLFQDQTNDHP